MQFLLTFLGFVFLGHGSDRSNWHGNANGGAEPETPEEPPVETEGEAPEDPAYNEALIRLTEASYADGTGAMDVDAPNARVISNVLAQQTEDMPSDDGTSNLFWVWGQFIDHDLSLTSAGHEEFAPIPVTEFNDPEFAIGSIIPFTRVKPTEGSGEDSPRAYENEITSLMDASMVYGSDAATEEALRDGAYLRLDTEGLLIETDHGMVAGDVRAAENVALTSMHTLFAREHNRWVDELREDHPDLDDDSLYEMARVRVEAEIQAITYNEWLPMLVGEDALAAYEGHDADETSAISVEFSTAAFRFGHTLLPTELARTNEDGSDIEGGGLSLRDAFFNASAIAEGGGVDPLFRGLAGTMSQNLDNQIVEDVRSFLLGEDGTTGLDLAALNIERGRDLGLPKYNAMREELGLERVETFSDISSDADVVARLERVYDDVDAVDAWVGGLAEDPLEGGMLGETFSVVIIDQFERIRDADDGWTELKKDLSVEEFEALWSTTLTDVILQNTGVETIQDDAFLAYDRLGGTEGDDAIAGDEDRDLLIGLEGDDTLDGGAGDDHIAGGTGDDVLTGGAGADRFGFAQGDGADVITDFQADEDRITLDVEDTEIDIASLFLPIEGGVQIELAYADRLTLLGADELDEDELAKAIDLI